MKNYSLSACENYIDKYVNQYKGLCTTLEEGVLGLGTIVLHDAPGKKSIVIKEFYINAWQSGHNIIMYNTLPKKYQRLIELTDTIH